MTAILGYMDRLRTLDLNGVEPMSHPHDTVNRLDPDEPVPGAALPTEALMRIAPDTHEPFVRVPGVFAGE
jgi:aspartyl-tRNA(Asn)/glutamyl-tRNA(Gln) amidotransferase subunit C